MIAEHLAGDLLPNPRIDASGFNQSELATGFWWFTQEKHGPTDVRAEESDRVSNQIDVMSKAFLGVTAACARCHDHKFDAISAEDYAALSGLLRSSRRAVGFLDPNETISQVAGKLELVRQQEHEMADGCFVVKPVCPNPNPSPSRCSLIASPMNHCGSTMVWRSAPPPPPMHPARSADASSRRRTPCWTLDEFQKKSKARPDRPRTN